MRIPTCDPKIITRKPLGASNYKTALRPTADAIMCVPMNWKQKNARTHTRPARGKLPLVTKHRQNCGDRTRGGTLFSSREEKNSQVGKKSAYRCKKQPLAANPKCVCCLIDCRQHQLTFTIDFQNNRSARNPSRWAHSVPHTVS